MGSCLESGPPHEFGKKDDRRLEPFAGVDGQHSHALRLDLHVAFDFDVGRLDLAQKIMQRRRLALLVGQRQGQEFVDWVGGFGPEPANQRSPAAVLAEQRCIKGKRGKNLRPRPPFYQLARGVLCGAFVRAHKGFGERTAASRRNFHERFVVKTDERGLERRGQRQIIVRQQRRATDGDEIDYRDMVFELEPVGACGLHIRRLEGSDHRLEKSVSAANQDHDIAFADAPDFAGFRVGDALTRGRR